MRTQWTSTALSDSRALQLLILRRAGASQQEPGRPKVAAVTSKTGGTPRDTALDSGRLTCGFEPVLNQLRYPLAADLRSRDGLNPARRILIWVDDDDFSRSGRAVPTAVGIEASFATRSLLTIGGYLCPSET
jgi:hypothetical protein